MSQIFNGVTLISDVFVTDPSLLRDHPILPFKITFFDQINSLVYHLTIFLKPVLQLICRIIDANLPIFRIELTYYGCILNSPTLKICNND